MNLDLIENIRCFVEDECKKPTSKYGYEVYESHFVPMVEHVKKLATILDADAEVVILAAWLHDIGSIIYGRENHHITGAQIAEEKLLEFNCPKDKIEKVKKCIINHRGSVNSSRESIEERIIAEVDGMSHFERIEGLFRAALVNERLSQKEARISVRTKLENSYHKLSSEAKKIIQCKYDAAMELLK